MRSIIKKERQGKEAVAMDAGSRHWHPHSHVNDRLNAIDNLKRGRQGKEAGAMDTGSRCLLLRPLINR